MTSPGQHEDRRTFSIRLTLMKAVVILVFSALAVAFWWFQVARHEEFAARADANHLRTINLRAPRGELLDRDGQMIVQNREIHHISISREQTQDIDATLQMLAQITGGDLAAMREAIERRKKEPVFRPIPVIENASRAQVARVKARLIELPGVIVQDVPTRRYPDDSLAAHVFGYVGEVNEAQLARPEFATLSPGDIVGHSGIELALNSLLMGHDGARYVRVDSLGREMFPEGEQAPVDGHPIKLTIDLDMQEALEDAFRHYDYWGAAAFIDPNNGDVLAMTSLPAYDPNDFAVGIDQATWDGLNKDPLKPLTNRLIQGTYPPGSTFKILMAVVGLQEKLITPSTRVHCSGGGSFYGRYFQCWRAGGHGSIDLRRAIEQSCNVYFYTIGAKLGNKIDIVHKWGERLGLVGKTGIDLPHEVPGFIASSEWAKKTRKDGTWYPGETVSVAIGQGAVAVTPMGLAMFASTIANGGTLFEPNLVKEVFDGEQWKPVPRPEPKATTQMDPEHVKAIHEGMWMVVNAAGTGGRARMEGYNVAGKTGTAQANISLERLRTLRDDVAKRYRDHGWWIFYAPSDKPEVAGVVFTENSEHGYLGAPIMKHVLETYFAKKEKRPLPTLVPAGTPAAPAAELRTGTGTGAGGR
ncbi:MAG TPA: penicillin-binding protein 2 [Vicinamibacterales bacterium]|nr:penicillin-binding protein 2 [Vicinamibacterales bacterium]